MFCVLFINLLFALAAGTANANNPITKLKVGKFYLECKGDCYDKFSFRDNIKDIKTNWTHRIEK